MMARRAWGTIAAAAVLMLACAAGPASAGLFIDYDVGNFVQTGLGNMIGTDVDKLFLTGLSGSMTLTEDVATIAQIANLSWVVGFTGVTSAGVKGPFTASRAIEVNGVTATISQPFTVTIGSVIDDFALQLGSILTLNFGTSGVLDIQPLAVSGSSDGYTPFNTTVSARFLLHDVPAAAPPESRIGEPGVLGWLIFGLALMLGLELRRRRA